MCTINLNYIYLKTENDITNIHVSCSFEEKKASPAICVAQAFAICTFVIFQYFRYIVQPYIIVEYSTALKNIQSCKRLQDKFHFKNCYRNLKYTVLTMQLMHAYIVASTTNKIHQKMLLGMYWPVNKSKKTDNNRAQLGMY